MRRPKFLRPAEGVSEDEAAFGVGVDDLDGAAIHGGDDIAGLRCVAPRHVLGAGGDGNDVELRLELGDSTYGGDNGSGAGHVGFHGLHVGGRLDAYSPGIKGDALADQREVVAFAGFALASV